MGRGYVNIFAVGKQYLLNILSVRL
jgi:hypothetical protein